MSQEFVKNTLCVTITFLSIFFTPKIDIASIARLQSPAAPQVRIILRFNSSADDLNQRMFILILGRRLIPCTHKSSFEIL